MDEGSEDGVSVTGGAVSDGVGGVGSVEGAVGPGGAEVVGSVTGVSVTGGLGSDGVEVAGSVEGAVGSGGVVVVGSVVGCSVAGVGISVGGVDGASSGGTEVDGSVVGAGFSATASGTAAELSEASSLVAALLPDLV